MSPLQSCLFWPSPFVQNHRLTLKNYLRLKYGSWVGALLTLWFHFSAAQSLKPWKGHGVQMKSSQVSSNGWKACWKGCKYLLIDCQQRKSLLLLCGSLEESEEGSFYTPIWIQRFYFLCVEVLDIHVKNSPFLSPSRKKN